MRSILPKLKSTQVDLLFREGLWLITGFYVGIAAVIYFKGYTPTVFIGLWPW